MMLNTHTLLETTDTPLLYDDLVMHQDNVWISIEIDVA